MLRELGDVRLVGGIPDSVLARKAFGLGNLPSSSHVCLGLCGAAGGVRWYRCLMPMRGWWSGSGTGSKEGWGRGAGLAFS